MQAPMAKFPESVFSVSLSQLISAGEIRTRFDDR